MSCRESTFPPIGLANFTSSRMFHHFVKKKKRQISLHDVPKITLNPDQARVLKFIDLMNINRKIPLKIGHRFPCEDSEKKIIYPASGLFRPRKHNTQRSLVGVTLGRSAVPVPRRMSMIRNLSCKGKLKSWVATALSWMKQELISFTPISIPGSLQRPQTCTTYIPQTYFQLHWLIACTSRNTSTRNSLFQIANIHYAWSGVYFLIH